MLKVLTNSFIGKCSGQKPWLFYISLLNRILIIKNIGIIITKFINLNKNLINTNSVKATPTKVAVNPPIISVKRKLLFGIGIESITSFIKNMTIIVLSPMGIFNKFTIKK